MKSYFDSFYEIIHKNSIKRRRMVSLLLVLSVFVSSGVLWELRDTVITMVNEPFCGAEEHEHTDECYEYRLVCGLDEDSGHTHTDECYEKVLVCGYEEHLHTMLCYTDEELPDSSVQSDDEESNIVSIDLPADTEEEMLLSQLDPAAAMEMQLGSAMRAAYAADPTELESPSGVSTIDNIARGIKITLFDYHDPEDELESKLNNYDISWNSSNHAWVHNHIKYAGVNNERNPDDDIMFFSYGTPDFVGTNADDDDDYHYGDYYYNVYTRTPVGQISKNNYSGDYNTNNRYPSQLSGNRPIQGIVKDQLSAAGYPVMNNTAAHSLDYLFSESGSAYKTVYTDVNHFLQDIGGHLVYNSNENYAYYNQDTHNFTVYESTYHIINNDHHRDQDFNNLTDTLYNGANGGEFKIGFFPFDQYDLDRRDPNFNGNGFNHHFGMKMEADFKNMSSPSEPIVFKYSGDDDMWVFVDDVLVLDIGGIHEPAAGMIDFTNGLVWTQDNALGGTAAKAYDDLKEDNPSLPEFDTIPKPDNGVNTDGALESKWKVQTISSIFAGINGKSCDAADNNSHNIKMFYLERGGCYSNLAIDMNLPTVRPLTVKKDVDFGGHYSNDYDRTNDENCPKYQFEVFVEEPADSGNYVPVEPTELGAGETNPFWLREGERKDFYLADDTRKYYVVEKGVNTGIYSNVLVNSVACPIEGGDVSSGTPLPFSSADTYNFTNVVCEETDTISVTKSWLDANGAVMANSPDYTIKFKLFRSDNGGTPQPVEIDGKMTFALKSSNSWTWTPTDTNGNPIQLPKRYGNHFYTYSVEELNVPDGYKASYGRDNNGNLIITNKDITNADIYVEKEWINAASEDQKPVTLTLKRKMAEFEESKPTSLKINLRDAAGNLLYTYSIPANASDGNQVFSGGSIEFAFNAPDGVEYYSVDSQYPKCVPSTVNVEHIGGNRLEISNLAADTDEDPATFANEVDIKIYTDEAEDSLLLLHHSFSQWTDGWIPNEGAEILTSGYNAYAKGDGLFIRGPGDTNRTASNQGARLDLDPLLFKVNHTYTFSTYVRYDENVGVPDSHGKYIIFKFTLYDGLGDADSNYHVIKQTMVYSGEWTQLLGTVTLPENVNPYGMRLIVESFDPEGQPFIGPGKFRMDEFTAIEGTYNMSVEQGTGKVTIGSGEFEAVTNGNAVYEYNTMQNYSSNGWYAFGVTSDDLSQKQYPNNNPTNYAVVVSTRKQKWHGVAKKITLTPGKKYHLISQVSGHYGGNDSHTINVTITYKDTDGADHWDSESVVTTGNQWGTIDWVYDFPANADTSQDIVIYYNTEGTEDFEVWSSRLYEATENADMNKAGYTLVNGSYVSNYLQYSLTLDYDSATNPLHLKSDYTNDTSFSKTINLNSTDGWIQHLDKTALNESSNHYIRYIYYVVPEDEVVSDMTEGTDYLLLGCENNNVATNDAEHPILVKNKCIRYRLPETGGGGRRSIYIFGSLLTAIGIISGSALYRRKRRRI